MPKTQDPLATQIDKFLVYLFTLFLVWPLWFAEQYFYSAPEIIEEVTKLGLVYWLVRARAVKSWIDVALVGVFFSLSETLFYLLVANNFMSLEPIALRVIFTWPMHIATVLVIWKFGVSKHKFGWLWGFLVAVLIHGIFNRLV